MGITGKGHGTMKSNLSKPAAHIAAIASFAVGGLALTSGPANGETTPPSIPTTAAVQAPMRLECGISAIDILPTGFGDVRFFYSLILSRVNRITYRNVTIEWENKDTHATGSVADPGSVGWPTGWPSYASAAPWAAPWAA